MSKSTATVCLPFLLFMITTMINSVNSSGAYKVKFITYQNVEGRRLNNSLCDDNQPRQIPPNECDFFLKATFWNGNQSSGPKKSKYSWKNVITFPFAYYDEKNTTSNPISINISSWKGNLKYKVDVMEDDTYKEYGDDVPKYERIETFAGNVTVLKPEEWVTVRRTRTGDPKIYLEFEVMVECFSPANTSSDSCFEINSQEGERKDTPIEGERKDTPIDLTALWAVLGVLGAAGIIMSSVIAYRRGLCKCGRHRKPETAAE